MGEKGGLTKLNYTNNRPPTLSMTLKNGIIAEKKGVKWALFLGVSETPSVNRRNGAATGNATRRFDGRTRQEGVAAAALGHREGALAGDAAAGRRRRKRAGGRCLDWGGTEGPWGFHGRPFCRLPLYRASIFCNFDFMGLPFCDNELKKLFEQQRCFGKNRLLNIPSKATQFRAWATFPR